MKWLRKTYVAIVMAFLYAPILVLIVFSFNKSKSRGAWTGFTLSWYQRLFTNEAIIQSLINTLVVALISSVLATVIGTLAAIGIRNMGRLSRSVVMNVTYMPVINPEIVTGVSLMLLFVFVKNAGVQLEFGFVTLVLAHITFNIPYVILNVMPKLRQMDVSVYEAAQDLGCSPMQAFFKVVIPQIMPGILSGFMMAFTFSLDDFVVTYFTAGNGFKMLPTTIYSMVRKKVNPQINALSTIIFLIVLVMLILMNILEAKRAKKAEKPS